DQRRQVGGRGRRGVAFGKAQVEVGGEIVAGRVAPFAVDEAVGGRQQFERVDAEGLEGCFPDRERGDPREVARRRGALDERKNVAERSRVDAQRALRLDPAPTRRQLVDDKAVVGGKRIERPVILPVRLLAARIAWDELAVAPFDHGGGAAIVVVERRRQQRRAQAPIHYRGGRVRAENTRWRW